MLFLPLIKSMLASKTGKRWFLNQMVLSCCDIINQIQNFIKILQSRDLTPIQHNIISIVTKHLHTTVFSLDEVDTFPYEAYDNFLHTPITALMMKMQSSGTSLLSCALIISSDPIATSFNGHFSSVPTILKIRKVVEMRVIFEKNFQKNIFCLLLSQFMLK